MPDENHVEAFKNYLASNQHNRPETIRTYKQTVKVFLDHIKKKPENINKEDLQKWVDYCSRYNKNSLTPKYGAVKKYVDFLIYSEILPEEFYGATLRRLKAPKLKFNEDNLDTLVLQPDKFEKLFDIAQKRDYTHYAMYKTAFWCQLRRCEIRGIKFSDINAERQKITIRKEIAKGGKEATIQISQECLDILNEYKDGYRPEPRKEDEDIIFLYIDRIYSNCKIWEMTKLYRQLAAIPEYHFHMWRHTGITEYAKIEKDIKKVQKQARHEDPATTMRYINYASEIYEQSYNAWEHAYAKNPSQTVQIPKVEVKQVAPVFTQSKRDELLALYDAGIITVQELQQRLKPIVKVMQ